jgi:AcrR family transcriptional regulator
MARTKEFDKEMALDAAIGVFREHGFHGTSTDMLVRAMKIGRQSLYDTFGDKWKLYCLAVERYSTEETNAHLVMLRKEPRAVESIQAMMDRVVETAEQACLGISSICEFGQSRAELTHIYQTADRRLMHATRQRLDEARAAGDISGTLSSDEMADFLFASVAGIRIAARSGASRKQLKSLGRLALRAID